MRNIELRKALRRYLRARNGSHHDFLREPTLTALGDALWVLCNGRVETLPEVMADFITSKEAFTEADDGATYILLDNNAA